MIHIIITIISSSTTRISEVAIGFLREVINGGRHNNDIRRKRRGSVGPSMRATTNRDRKNRLRYDNPHLGCVFQERVDGGCFVCGRNNKWMGKVVNNITVIKKKKKIDK
jgi:hypothetical protein